MWSSEAENKFLLAPQTAIIKNIVYEILRECDRRDFVVEKRFVTFLVHLVTLQMSREGEIDFNEKFDRESIEEVIAICMRHIIDENETPANITLKMQVFFIENSKPYDDIVAEYHENLAKKTGSLVREITESGALSGKEELAVLQKKIIVDIILQTALGSPSNQEVVAEIAKALASIMTEADLENFAALEPHNRLESLKEIRLIVCGIVLFNKDAGLDSGSSMDENIPDLTKTLLKSFDSIESLLQFTLCDIMDRVNILTTAFDGAIAVGKSFVLNAALLETSELDVMVDLLTLNRQHEIYVRKLLGNLKAVKALIETRVRSFAEKLAKLHEIVQYRSAVPSIQIFPRFRELTDEWTALHDLSYVLSQQNQINNYLQHLSELCRQQQFDDIVHKLLGDNHPVESDHTRLQKRRHLKLPEDIAATGAGISIVQAPESNSEIEYLGFCAYVLAESRILLPSVPEMGCALWSQKIYGFYSVEAAKLFVAKPKLFIGKIWEVMRKSIQLILFFDIYGALKAARSSCAIDIDALLDRGATAGGGAKGQREAVEKEVQTELHPVPFRRDEGYVWNLWELRRKAIELADLRRKKTTSAQTALSHHRLHIASQRIENRPNDSQTGESKASSTH